VIRLRAEYECVHKRSAEEELLHPFERPEPCKVAEETDPVVADRESPRFAGYVVAGDLNLPDIAVPRPSLCAMRMYPMESGSKPIIFAATASMATWSALASMKF